MAYRRFRRVWRLVVLGTGLLVMGMVSSAAAQERDTVPRNPDAELMFEQGIAAYERGDFDTAYDRFGLVQEYSLNQKTTASLLMAGKTRVQMGRHREAIEVLETLLDRYPETSYRDNAERLLSQARKGAQRKAARADTLRLGVALPMDSENVTLAQALFNGLRLAVDEHNGIRRRYLPPPGLERGEDSLEVYDTEAVHGDSLADAEGQTTVVARTDTVRVDSLQILTERIRRPDWVAKMYFRSVGDEPDSVRAAVETLAEEKNVDVIVGPLYSRTARTAGAAAEEADVLLVPPLATDESVSAGRDHVFQPNPTIPFRGRMMARFVEDGLLADSVAVVYERRSRISREIANSFQTEAAQNDLGVPFVLPLDNAASWSRLPELVDADSTLTDSLLATTDAVYMPMSGRNASGKLQDALTGLGRLNIDRALGNAEWHDLPIRRLASQFKATYSNDFYVQTARPEVQTFIRRYRMLTGETPDHLSVRGRRLAYAGYDIARFLLEVLSPSDASPGPAALRSASEYDGLGTRIDFQGANVNQSLFFHRYRTNRLELLR